ncbi:hypothetical protein FQN60_017923, partial [Etheostoma spectabile]
KEIKRNAPYVQDEKRRYDGINSVAESLHPVLAEGLVRQCLPIALLRHHFKDWEMYGRKMTTANSTPNPLGIKGSVSHHDGGDDGDESITVGQQSVGGLGAAVALSVGRSDALQERGGSCVAPRAFLLHLLLDVVLYDFAAVVFPHRGGAKGPQRTQEGPWTRWTLALSASGDPSVELEFRDRGAKPGVFRGLESGSGPVFLSQSHSTQFRPVP